MNSSDYNDAEDLRSSIWTVSSSDLARFFLNYTFIYIGGSGYLVWIHVERDAAVHDIVSDIITGVSLIGIGIAPTLALVLVETWRLTMIFSRGLELRLRAKELRLRAKEEKFREGIRKEVREEAREELEQAVKAAYEAGVRDGMAKIRENGSSESGCLTPE